MTVPLGGNYTLGFSRLNQYAISFLGYSHFFNNSYSYLYLQLDVSLIEGYYANVSSLPVQVYACSYNSYYYGPYFVINGLFFNILIHNRSQDPTLPYIRSSYYYLNFSEYDSSVYNYFGFSVYENGYYYWWGYQYPKPNYYGLIYGPHL